MPRQKERFISIQWLRAIAAVMVVINHALWNTNAARGLTPEAERSLFGFSNWDFGVSIFFLVSGFIMITSVRAVAEPEAVLHFIGKRLVRIVPLYWIMTTLGLLIVIVSPSQLPIEADKLTYVLGSYLFIPVARAPGILEPLVGQGWTLNYEMLFYAVFALSLFLPRRKAIIWMTVLFMVLSFLGRNETVANPALYTWTDGLLLEFLLGVYVGLAYLQGLRLPVGIRVLAIFAGFALSALKLSGPATLVSGVPAALILIGFALGPQPTPTIFAGWFALVGDASYSLYLTHTFILRLLSRIWTMFGGMALHPAVFVAFALVVTVAASLVIYRFVERPMTRALQRRAEAAIDSFLARWRIQHYNPQQI